MRRRYFAIAAALFLSALTSFSGNPSKIYHKGWIDFNKNGKKDVYEDPKAPVEERVKDLLSQMTLEEKTCQMATLYGSGRVLTDNLPTPEWKNEIWKDGIGNIDEEHNGKGKSHFEYAYPFPKHVNALDEIQRWFIEETRLGIPAEFTNEGIRGLSHDRATLFPSQSGQGASWNKDLISEIADVEAQEARALGYTNVYSPVLDVAQDPRWGRCVETYGEDPYLVGQLGKRMVEGLQSHKVVSTPKHFAVYSIPEGGRDGDVRTAPHATPREVRSIYLEPFRMAFQEAGALGTMSSYNDYDGVPVTGSYHFLTEILRNEWGFKGYVVSDSDAVEYIWNKHHVAETYEDGIAQAVNAGLNIRTTFTKPEVFIIPLRQAVADGKVSMETIDRRVSEILYVKFWEGLFDDPFTGDAETVESIVHNDAHQELALKAARQSLVLLKNEGGLLPLSKDIRKLAVIGPNAKATSLLGSHYGATNAPIVSVFEGIRSLLPDTEILYSEGCEIIDPHFPESEILDFDKTEEEQKLLDEAVATAKQAEAVVLVMGGNTQTVKEGSSRTSLDLPGRQNELIRLIHETGKPVVLVLLDGRAASINYADRNIAAILHGWFPGERGGQAVAEALFGDYNPGGKLSFTFPKSVGQIPFAFPYKPKAHSNEKTTINGSLYPFGHGLSYTTFEYSDLKVTPESQDADGKVTVSFKVKNTGERSGDEVVQLYVRDEVSSVTTYEKNLRGFERVPLEPGETKEVSFTLGRQELGLWDKDNRFTVEPGSFKVMVGASSEDIRLEGKFEIR